MDYIDVSNSYFKRGFIYMNAKENVFGGCYIRHSNFVNNTSECGTILNLNYLNPATSVLKYIYMTNSTFTNNTASKFGGVIYSLGQYNNDRISIVDCTFNNNHAESGNIIYAHSKKNLSFIVNKNSNDVSTIPEYFKKVGNKGEGISILSGESIPEGIKCKFNKL